MRDFVALTGLAGCSVEKVKEGLRTYARTGRGEFSPTDWEGEADDVLIIAQSPAGHVTVQYPVDFLDWDDASAFLSEFLNTTAFSFHIHEGELWMYGLFEQGEQVDGYNPMPEFWGALSDEERQAWAGNPDEVVALWPNVSKEAIEKYLVRWDNTVRSGQRAYPDDSYGYKDASQLFDFMKKLGLSHAQDERDQPRGPVFAFWVDGD